METSEYPAFTFSYGNPVTYIWTVVKLVSRLIQVILNENERGWKYPQLGWMGENTPFTEQSKEKERDNGHDTCHVAVSL